VIGIGTRRVVLLCNPWQLWLRWQAGSTPTISFAEFRLMVIKFVCPGCSKNYSVPDGMAGKRANCPCGIKIPVPAPGPTTETAGAELDGDPLAVGAAAGGLDGDPLAVGAAAGTAVAAEAGEAPAINPLRGAPVAAGEGQPAWAAAASSKRAGQFSTKILVIACVGSLVGGIALGVLGMMLFGPS
jgi:hypothetical protein